MKKLNIIIITGLITVLVVFLIIFAINKISGKGSDNQSSAVNLFKEAEELEQKQDLLAAKDKYLQFIAEFPNNQKISEAIKKSEDLNIKLIFSAIVTPDSFYYEVKPNDSLTKIAKDNNTTIELIKRSNSLKGDVIRPGMRLKITKAKFNVFVDKSQNILILKKDEEVIKNYRVSTGANNCSPVGKFKIINKIVDPVWFKAGAAVPPESPENILGTRWMGFDIPGYGIHGTTEPQSISQQVTQGCVRMINNEVEELYDILPVGTEVIIVD